MKQIVSVKQINTTVSRTSGGQKKIIVTKAEFKITDY